MFCNSLGKLEFQSVVGSLRLVGSSLNSIRRKCVLRSVLRISRHTADFVKTHDLLRIEMCLEMCFEICLEISKRFSIRSRISIRFADSDLSVTLMVDLFKDRKVLL